MECLSCKSLSGEKHISPGPTVDEGKYWVLEHAYPAALKGWLVLVLKRHTEALHELARDEFREMAEMQYAAIQPLRRLTGCEKEYVMCFAESEGFKHIHVHIVPKPADLPDDLRGPRIFALLAVREDSAVPREDIRVFCEQMRKELSGRDAQS